MITTKTFQLLDQMEQLEGNGSRKAKMDIIKKNLEHLEEYFDITLNPYRVYKIVQIPENPAACEMYDKLEDLAKYLEAQKGGTDQMKNIAAQFIQNADVHYGHPTAPKWCRAAILKESLLGVAEKSLNKCGMNLPIFKCLLAEPNKANSLEGITYPAFIQPKLDGCRALRLPDEIMYGRNGRVVPNLQAPKHIKFGSDEYVYDGEFYSFERKFNAIVGFFTADDRELPPDIKFVVFNIMTKKEWDEQNCTTSYVKQLKLIGEVAKNSENLIRIPTAIVNSAEECMAKYEEYLKEGFEGAIVRNMETTYRFCDSSDRAKVEEGILVKLKPFEYADCVIKSAYEGKSPNTRGKFGGFTLDFNGKEVDCGGGFSKEQREEFWKNPKQFVGKWCRVKLTEKTEDNSLRFPIFDSFRDAK